MIYPSVTAIVVQREVDLYLKVSGQCNLTRIFRSFNLYFRVQFLEHSSLMMGVSLISLTGISFDFWKQTQCGNYTFDLNGKVR